MSISALQTDPHGDALELDASQGPKGCGDASLEGAMKPKRSAAAYA